MEPRKDERIFCTTAELNDLSEFRGERYGKIWQSDELKMLKEYLLSGFTIAKICYDLGRPADGVIKKLESMAAVRSVSLYNGPYQYSPGCLREMAKRKTDALSFNQGEENMENNQDVKLGDRAPTGSLKLVDYKVLIAGRDSANVSDDQIFGMIADLEAQIKALNAIEHKPKKLSAKIEALKADIASLVDIVDNR